ncbi:hypothetical protein P7K49_012837 [Saguinus oedipus]|uniref:Uncharacterized protein n=1 Tax=Saguinus oedipus TaxID=9490 RepID=A0ABQ9VE67_SAGOE|nr:hypothetical protein P7K49_012837 [Saguinus oedipus]
MLDHRARPHPVPHCQEPKSEDMELPLEAMYLRAWSWPPCECHNHSPNGDSSSNYVNSTSKEKDYDKGLSEEEEEEEGITYYIRYCPKDDGYQEGMDCNGEEYLAHTACTPWTPTSARRPSVEEWMGLAGPHTQGHRAEGSQDYLEGYLPIPEFEPSVLEARDQEEDGTHCPSKEGSQDYYTAEANGNTGASPYCLRCEDGDLEDQEEDIDQIVAEIKISLSMTSIASVSEASPEHGPEPGSGTLQRPGFPARPQQAQGEGQVTVNLPSKAKHRKDPQRGFRPNTRTPDERLKWPHEQKRVHFSPAALDVLMVGQCLWRACQSSGVYSDQQGSGKHLGALLLKHCCGQRTFSVS